MRAIEPPLDVRLREFVLGTISERDRDEVEQRIFDDESTYDLLIAIEEEVLDECVRGKLPERETKNVLEYIEKLPDGRTRIDFARELGFYASNHGSMRSAPHERGAERSPFLTRGFFSAAMAWPAAALVLAVTIGFLGGRLSSYRPAPQTTKPPLAIPDTASSSSSTASILLTAGTLRGAAESDLPVLELSPSQLLLKLQLDVAFDKHESYRAVVHDVDAEELFSAGLLNAEIGPERIVVAFSIPTERLPAGDYFVSLFGVLEPDVEERLGRYAFRIRKR